MKYFLAFENATGDVVQSGFEDWFSVTDFSIDGFNGVSVGPGSPITTDSLELSTLNLTFDNDTALVVMLEASLGAGKHNRATLVATTDDGLETLYKIDIDNVLLASLADAKSGGFSVSLDYGQIDITTHKIGATGTDPVFGYNLITKLNGSATGTAPGSGSQESIAPTKYFVAINGMNGGSTDPNHLGWFELTDFDFGLDRIITGHNKAGLAAFTDVHLTFEQDVALTRLLQLSAGGTGIKSMRIEGVVGSGIDQKAVYDLTLNNVKVDHLDDIGGSGFSMDVSYRLGELSTIGPNETTADVVKWDTVTGKVTTAILSDPTIGSAVGVNIPTTTAVSYLLAIDGVGGNAANVEFKNFLALQDFSFSIDGASAGGKTSFSHVNLVLPDESALAQIFQTLTIGNGDKGASIIGLNLEGKEVYRLNLDQVVVSNLFETAGDGLSVELAFNEIELRTLGANSVGTLVNNTPFKWDLSLNAAGDGVADTGAGDPIASIAPTQFFMMVDGLFGGSAAPGFSGWFEISDFALQALNNIDPVSNKTVDPDIGDLAVSVEGSAALVKLMDLQAKGQMLDGVRIVGVVDNGGLQQIYEMNIADVLVSGIQDSSSAGYSVVFDFGQIQIKTNEAGKANLPTIVEWDIAALAAKYSDNGITAPATGSIAVVPGESNYFLAIEGLGGDASQSGHKGWFSVDEFGFDISSLISDRKTGGPVTSETAFDGITVHLNSDLALAALMQKVADGSAFGKVTLHGMVDDGFGNAKTVYDLDLSTVIVTAVQKSAAGGLDVTFDFAQLGLASYTINKTTGVATIVETFGWDLVNDKSIKLAGGNAIQGAQRLEADVDTHFMLLDGMDGKTSDPRRGGWFDIADFSVSALNTSTSQLGPGNGIGEPEFGTLSVKLDSDSALTDFLSHLSDGKIFERLVLSGVALDGKTVYDLAFGDLALTAVDDRAGLGYDLSFKFSIAASNVFDINGKLVSSSGWDIVHAASYGEGLPATIVSKGGSYVGSNFNDLFIASVGNDTLTAGLGNDTISYAGSKAVTVSLASTLAQATNGSGTDMLSGFENIIGSAFNDRLTGTSGANIIDGGTGNDRMTGGLGNDSYYVNSLSDIVIEAAGGGTKDTIFTAVNFDLSASTKDVENLYAFNVGSAGLVLGGNAFANEIRGGDGNDQLSGQAGNDTLQGGLGADTMQGGSEDDSYYVDSALDVIVELAGNGTGDTIYTSINFDLSTNAIEVENLVAFDTGGTNLNLTGNSLANNIISGEGDDVLLGLDGADTLDGGLGADTMQGGNGNDTYLVDNAGDLIIENNPFFSGGLSDLIRTSINFTLGAATLVEFVEAIEGSGNLVINGNASNNNIIGSNSGNDTLLGLDGNDFLNGGGGNDRLVGGLGVDAYFGGSGLDEFVLSPQAAIDVISDFSNADDQLVISASLFGIANAPLSGLQFITNATGLAADGGDLTTRFIYNTSSSTLLFDADGTGGAGGVQIVSFSNFVAPTINDFSIIA